MQPELDRGRARRSRDGAVALVTGGGSGVGRAAALELARDGFAVVVAGRRTATLEAVTEEGASSAGTIVPMIADVRDEDSVRQLFERVVERFGRLDVLFNNAGIVVSPTPLEEVTTEVWEDVMKTNLTGAFYCTREALAQMKRQRPQGGRIINNGSISAHVPRPGASAYTVAKHAMTGLTKATALEGREFGIACGQVDIGNASTESTALIESGFPQSDGSVRAEPTMSAYDVGRAVAYMASLPLEANVLSMTIMATAMPFIGRG